MEAEMANRPIFAVLAALAALAVSMPAFADPYKLGVGVNVEGQQPSPYSSYPAPHMIGQPVKVAPVAPPKKPKVLKATATQNNPRSTPLTGNVDTTPQPPPMQAAASASPPPGVLPNQFLGNWNVIGQRSGVQALPQYQQGIDGIFTASNSQTWNITGSPGGYAMGSSSGVQNVQVGQCNQSTAFLRYQHQVGNTMAQEAIVMQLSPDGRSFQGMQRITIKKPGEPQPRAQVTYKLMGSRQ
jgi:hypothetical protein